MIELRHDDKVVGRLLLNASVASPAIFPEREIVMVMPDEGARAELQIPIELHRDAKVPAFKWHLPEWMTAVLVSKETESKSSREGFIQKYVLHMTCDREKALKSSSVRIRGTYDTDERVGFAIETNIRFACKGELQIHPRTILVDESRKARLVLRSNDGNIKGQLNGVEVLCNGKPLHTELHYFTKEAAVLRIQFPVEVSSDVDSISLEGFSAGE